MHELTRLLIVIGAAGVVLTLLGAVVIWSRGETRRLRRGLTRILGGKPHGLLVAAPGKGRAVGLNFANNTMAVAWDAGAWGLVYRLDDLVGAEAVVDGQVVGRVQRGEDRRALDSVGGAKELVRLRLIFDDPAWPDFDLDLWTPESMARRGAPGAGEAIKDANRWLASTEAILKRASARRFETPPPPAPAPVVAQPAAVDDPPWDEPEPAFDRYIDPDEALN
jgi:hypothetical protein